MKGLARQVINANVIEKRVVRTLEQIRADRIQEETLRLKAERANDKACRK